MNIKHRMRVIFVMAIAAMTGLNACSEEQGTATNSHKMNPNFVKTVSMQNITESIRKKEQLNMWITVNGHRFEVVLEDSATTQALITQLPLTLHMEELNGNENTFSYQVFYRQMKSVQALFIMVTLCFMVIKL